jgi:hypothetical protein
MAKEPVRYLSAEKMKADDFGVPFTNLVGEIVYDGCLAMSSQWATMTQESWEHRGCCFLGTGRGQKYQRNAEGHLVKVAG